MGCCEALAWHSADHTGFGLGTGVATGLSSSPALWEMGDLAPTAILHLFLPKYYSFHPHHPFCPVLTSSPSFPLLPPLCWFFFQLQLSVSFCL